MPIAVPRFDEAGPATLDLFHVFTNASGKRREYDEATFLSAVQAVQVEFPGARLPRRLTNEFIDAHEERPRRGCPVMLGHAGDGRRAGSRSTPTCQHRHLSDRAS
jgi:hypothetical protein